MFTINQCVIATAVFALFSFAAANANAESLSAQSKCTYTKQTPVMINHAVGHMLVASELSCTYEDKSGTGFMAGATGINQEVAQLFQGNGDDLGYMTYTLGDDATVAQWHGHITTVMKDGKPNTTGKGKWEYVGGAGKYQNIKGKGEWSLYFVSQNEFILDWKGKKD